MVGFRSVTKAVYVEQCVSEPNYIPRVSWALTAHWQILVSLSWLVALAPHQTATEILLLWLLQPTSTTLWILHKYWPWPLNWGSHTRPGIAWVTVSVAGSLPLFPQWFYLWCGKHSVPITWYKTCMELQCTNSGLKVTLDPQGYWRIVTLTSMCVRASLLT